MATWTIRPKDGTCDDVEVKPCTCSDGKFTLSQNVPVGTEFIISYTNGNVTKDIRYVRQTECDTCRCDKIAFKWRQVQIPLSDGYKIVDNNSFSVAEHNNEWLGNLEITDPTCNGKIEVSGGTDHRGERCFTNIHIEEGTNKVIASFSKYIQDKDHSGRVLKFAFLINGIKCAEYKISQQAWRGTDDGVTAYADINDGEDNHPIFFLGYSDESNPSNENAYCRSNGAKQCNGNNFTCNELSISGSYDDDDTITSKNGAWYYDVNATPQYEKLDSNFVTKNLGSGEWLKLSFATVSDGYCSKGMIKLHANTGWEPNIDSSIKRIKLKDAITQGYARKVEFWLTSVPNLDAVPLNPTIVCEQAPAVHHPGEECALKWRYEVIQLPKGFYICFSKNIEGKPDQYDMIRIGEVCGCDNNRKCNCKCKGT